MNKKVFSIIAFVLFSFSVVGKEEVLIYTYHLKAPFIISLKNKKGLSFELVNQLNKLSKKYKYKLVYMPRKRLDFITKNKIVLWSNPGWVDDKKSKVSMVQKYN
jgi:polar amino acid transport system substrate-binding protein